jgi:hypothetical protein
MLIQYSYAVLTMAPCPIWFHYRYASASFLTAVFCWSVYNGATFYIDVFGNRFQKELEQMKREVVKWQSSPDLLTSPIMTPKADAGTDLGDQVDKLSLLSEQVGASGIDGGAKDVIKERKIGDLPA